MQEKQNMKMNCRKRLATALIFFAFQLAVLMTSKAQAPASIAGNTFGVQVTSGSPPFASSGYFLFVPTSSTAYQIVGIENITGSIGTNSYSASGAIGTANLTDNHAGSIHGSFDFNTAISGSDSLSDLSYGGSQSGNFVMFTNPVPNSITGQSYFINVQNGSAPFASSGGFIISAATGYSYTITAIGGAGTNSTGAYSYAKLNASCGSIQLNDSLAGSSTAYLVYSNSIAGGYYLTQPSPGGYQIGYSTLLTALAPASIAGDSFISAVTYGTPPFATRGYFLFLPANSGTNYQVIGLGGVTNSSGTYSYSAAGSAGMLSLSDSISGLVKGNFFYFTSPGGSYALSAGTSGQYIQNGNFSILTNSVPNSIAGQGFYITVTNGSYPFATNGSFNLTTAASGNSYTITAISGGGKNSTGTYSFSKLNASCGGIQLTDSVAGIFTVYLAMSNAISGGYVLTQPSSGGYQIGLVSILNTAIAITSPTSGSTYVTNVSSINLGGTASDSVGVTQVTWSNNRGGSGTATGTTAWSINGIALQGGTNIITVTAHDAAGNSANATLSVKYILPALVIIRQNSKIMLAWPTNAADFTLENTTNLNATVWTTNSAPPYIVNGQITVTNTMSNGATFYRLIK